MLTIRPLEASDRRVLEFVFGHLGDRSRFQRFMVNKRELSPWDLSHLMSVDHWHHEALIGFAAAPRQPVAIARYVRLEEFDIAEIAFTVADDWQRRGVGVELGLALRERARRAGVRRFTATMLRTNRGALALARRLGECRVAAADGPVMTVAGSWV